MIYLLNRVREFKRQAVHWRGHAHITCSLHEFSHISRLSDRKLPDQSHVDFDFRARRNCARAGIVDWNGKTWLFRFSGTLGKSHAVHPKFGIKFREMSVPFAPPPPPEVSGIFCRNSPLAFLQA